MRSVPVIALDVVDGLASDDPMVRLAVARTDSVDAGTAIVEPVTEALSVPGALLLPTD